MAPAVPQSREAMNLRTTGAILNWAAVAKLYSAATSPATLNVGETEIAKRHDLIFLPLASRLARDIHVRRLDSILSPCLWQGNLEYTGGQETDHFLAAVHRAPSRGRATQRLLSLGSKMRCRLQTTSETRRQHACTCKLSLAKYSKRLRVSWRRAVA
jgi:hypothetical protein